MTLFDRLFYSESMLAVFSDRNRLQRMLDFESALALAEASLGLIPADAARVIVKQSSAENIDLASLCEAASRAGNLAIPLIQQLTFNVDRISPEAARSVHWGATSQDVIDTGLVLQMREGLRLIDSQLLRLNESLAALAARHAATEMPGRTWLQQAIPITFGWKASTWLDATLRNQQRLRELHSNSLALQFGGAAGTLASLGADGSAIAGNLARILGLAQADISWHATRDRFAEIVTALGILVGSLGKIARDISLLAQTEVGEVHEAVGHGRGGSSTMPHKRNPVACSAVLAASVRVPGLVATVLAAMDQEHERGLGNWQAEWESIPEIFNLSSGALEKMHELIAGLQVDSNRMATNLEMTEGLIYAEAASKALAHYLGKQPAHALVERLCQIALTNKRHLRNVLADDEEAGRLLPPADLHRLFDPTQYLGNSQASIDRVLVRASFAGVAARSECVESAGARIHFKISGPESLPVLVLSHSIGSDMTMWDAQLSQFSKHFRILRFDARGHGQSTATPGEYSIDLLGSDLIALLDTLGIEQVDFCGLSMGGMIGQWLALHAASRLRKLVLCNTAARIGSFDLWNTRIAAVQSGGVGALVPVVIGRWFTPDFLRSHPGLMIRTGAMMAATSSQGYISCCAALRDADFHEDVKQVTVPVLVVAGTHDPATPVADGRYLAETIPGAQFVELNASHLSNIEADKDFTQAVLQFLKG